MFVATALLTVAGFLFSVLIMSKWRLAIALLFFFISIMAAGAGMGTLFHRKLMGMGLGFVCGLAWFCYWLSQLGVSHFLDQF
jgi:hypothetical protein